MLSRDEQIELLKRSVEEWNIWRQVNPGVKPNLLEANLQAADLRGANLQGATLLIADMQWADVSGANLNDAKLVAANLRECNFRQTSFRKANLEGTQLQGADFFEADLFGVKTDGKTQWTINQFQDARHVPRGLRKGAKHKKSSDLKEELSLLQNLLEVKESEKLSRSQVDAIQSDAEKDAVLQKELDELKARLKFDSQERARLEKELKTAQEKRKATDRIHNALRQFKGPNEYIVKELKIHERFFWLFVVLAGVSFLYFIFIFVHTGRAMGEEKTAVTGSENLYGFLLKAIPYIVSLSLMGTFIRSAFKRRQNIEMLNEQKRQIDTIEAAMKGHLDAKEDAEATLDLLEESIKGLAQQALVSTGRYDLNSKDQKEEEESNTKTVIAMLNGIKKLLSS
ncbi:MAG TPA: hypothetical protein DCE41_34555 [Cytophagales bacterium]|nr:hypothetical protein [Cytophagales bacterium]HAA23926.1 hypothetical protein [Cytophagales bacterium]HAP63522.1 hypothetical protein [Cytophagales bacterium]